MVLHYGTGHNNQIKMVAYVLGIGKQQEQVHQIQMVSTTTTVSLIQQLVFQYG